MSAAGVHGKEMNERMYDYRMNVRECGIDEKLFNFGSLELIIAHALCYNVTVSTSSCKIL